MEVNVIDWLIDNILNTVLKVALAGFLLGVLFSAGVYYALR